MLDHHSVLELVEALLGDKYTEVELEGVPLVLLVDDVHRQADQTEVRLQLESDQLTAEGGVWNDERL